MVGHFGPLGVPIPLRWGVVHATLLGGFLGRIFGVIRVMLLNSREVMGTVGAK